MRNAHMFSLLFEQPVVFILWIVAILLALSFHEFSHALAGRLLGDHTAERLGRLTLNPAAHVDPLGILALVVAGFGWGKPVPFNTYNLKNQKWGPVMIAFAGPTMNVLLAVTFGLILRVLLPVLGEGNLLVQALFFLVFINLALFLFNLIPIPPLDGSKLLLALLSSPQHARARTFLETRGPLLLIGLIIFDNLFDLGIFGFLSSIISVAVRALLGNAA
ncbi:site-2 protease family protein [Candidatus Uhrbacteria bacterium]|nr:site-2 protease family protein [Candidatus Uhrbacteria bacterium]